MIEENSFSKIMINMSDRELQNYIDNKSDFENDAVLAAIWELEKRNNAGEDAKDIKLQIEQNRKDEYKKKERIKKESFVTIDPNAPVLYHKSFILVYGALFSVFAGSILMALNLARLDKKKTAWLVVLSGFIYSAIQLIILNQIEPNTTGLTLPVNFLGIFLLESFFWKKKVPFDLIFRKRSIWGALIIVLVIWSPLIYSIIVTGGM